MKAIAIISVLILSTIVMKMSNVDIIRTPVVAAVNEANLKIDAFVHGSAMTAEQNAIIEQYAKENPSEAPYWFSLLSTLSTMLIGAIVRLLEKRLMRRKDGTLIKRIFGKEPPDAIRK